MAYNYSRTNYSKEHMARSVGRGLPISTKASTEICNSLRQKSISRAKIMLKEVIDLKKPIKYTRFREGAGHKKGIGAGKYPLKAASHILKIVKNTEANAQFKGLNTSNLQIIHISAQNAGNVWRYGRHRRRKMKRTHIEIVVEEGKKKEAKPKEEKKEKQPSEIPVEKEEEKSVEKKTPKNKIPVEKKVVKKEIKPKIAKNKVTKPKEATKKAVQPKKVEAVEVKKEETKKTVSQKEEKK